MNTYRQRSGQCFTEYEVTADQRYEDEDGVSYYVEETRIATFPYGGNGSRKDEYDFKYVRVVGF